MKIILINCELSVKRIACSFFYLHNINKNVINTNKLCEISMKNQ